PAYRDPNRVAKVLARAGAAERQLVDAAIAVHGVRFITDDPRKHHGAKHEPGASPTTVAWREAMSGARGDLLLQTPYLVLSEEVSDWLLSMRSRPFKPQVVISTNSLASSDVFLVYALTHKHKRRLSLVFDFHVYEYKPHAGEAMHATSLRGSRRGLHGKSFVADGRVAMIGSHNLDPRSDRYNIESWVRIDDPAFAALLSRSIRDDIAPENSWVIGPRDPAPVLPEFVRWVGKKAEYVPVFDLWPIRNATRYEFVRSADCPSPPAPTDPMFRRCHVPVGDFTEVRLSVKALTRLASAFGGVLVTVL
ncbi:MAG: phospholipase D-like domain-containing protein, partial [Pseudomonadota bacterium]|nr:phospholipase D-like domain-containing protein [Pseudomonadota bacterium]